MRQNSFKINLASLESSEGGILLNLNNAMLLSINNLNFFISLFIVYKIASKLIIFIGESLNFPSSSRLTQN